MAVMQRDVSMLTVLLVTMTIVMTSAETEQSPSTAVQLINRLPTYNNHLQGGSFENDEQDANHHSEVEGNRKKNFSLANLYEERTSYVPAKPKTNRYSHSLSYNLGKRFSEFIGGKRKRFNEFIGGKRKRFNEFIEGKRKRFSEFIGGKKRLSEFIGGKKRFSEFIGGKKRFSEFIGGKKRSLSSSNFPPSQSQNEFSMSQPPLHFTQYL